MYEHLPCFPVPSCPSAVSSPEKLGFQRRARDYAKLSVPPYTSIGVAFDSLSGPLNV